MIKILIGLEENAKPLVQISTKFEYVFNDEHVSSHKLMLINEEKMIQQKTSHFHYFIKNINKQQARSDC